MFSSSILPELFVPVTLCSQNSILPEFYVLEALCWCRELHVLEFHAPEVPCSRISTNRKLYDSRALCSRSLVFPEFYAFYAVQSGPRLLCPRSCIRPKLYVPQSSGFPELDLFFGALRYRSSILPSSLFTELYVPRAQCSRSKLCSRRFMFPKIYAPITLCS